MTISTSAEDLLVEAITDSWYISPTVHPSAMAKWCGKSLRAKYPNDLNVIGISKKYELSAMVCHEPRGVADRPMVVQSSIECVVVGIPAVRASLQT